MDSTDHVLLADLFGKKLYYSHSDFINYTFFDEDIFFVLMHILIFIFETEFVPFLHNVDKWNPW